jgi:hypothetical protein
MRKQKNDSSFLQSVVQQLFRRGEVPSHKTVITLAPVSTKIGVQSRQEPDERLQSESDVHLLDGCTTEEIHAWVLLRDRYQHGGSDRGAVFHHLEFLKLLVQNGKIER